MFMAFISTTITPKTAPVPILAGRGISRVTQVLIKMRSAGTSTYVAVGGADSQSARIAAVGEGISFDTPRGKRYLDVRSLFISSDTADAVMEIIADTYEGI